MSLRPASARWFELLTARNELTMSVEALAREIGADPARARPFEWPNARLRDGSVADY